MHVESEVEGGDGAPCKADGADSADPDFYGTSAVICPGVKIIPANAFQGCTSLTDVTLPESLTTIEQYAFEETGIVNLTFPNNVTDIQAFAFHLSRELARITLSSSLTSIGLWAFYDTVLVEVTIPEAVTSIGYEAFAIDTLTTVYLPDHDAVQVWDLSASNPFGDAVIVAATATQSSTLSTTTVSTLSATSSTSVSTVSTLSSTSTSSAATTSDTSTSEATTSETSISAGTTSVISVPALSATSTSVTQEAPTAARLVVGLVVAAPPGAQELHVDSEEGFSEGDAIVIADGGGLSEVGTISAFGSILLSAPLKNGYPIGSLITLSVPADTLDTPESDASSSAPIIVAVASCVFCCMVGIAGWLMSRYFKSDTFRAISSKGHAVDVIFTGTSSLEPSDQFQVQVDDCSGGRNPKNVFEPCDQGQMQVDDCSDGLTLQVDDCSDGLTMSQVNTIGQINNSKTWPWRKHTGSDKSTTVSSESPETKLGIHAQDGEGMHFWFMPRKNFIGLPDDQPLPRHQTLRDAGMLVRLYITRQDVISGKARRGKGVVSHRWSQRNHIDLDCVKLRKLKEILRNDPSVEYLWLDWISIPQACINVGAEGGYSAEDKAELDLTLENVLSYLYLGCTVLLLWDARCRTRFWTSVEAWTSMRAVSKEGVVPASDDCLRLRVFAISGDEGMGDEAAYEFVTDLWLHKSAQQTAAELRRDEYAATNARDKDISIEAILRLSERIQGSVYTQSASQGLVTCL